MQVGYNKLNTNFGNPKRENDISFKATTKQIVDCLGSKKLRAEERTLLLGTVNFFKGLQKYFNASSLGLSYNLGKTNEVLKYLRGVSVSGKTWTEMDQKLNTEIKKGVTEGRLINKLLKVLNLPNSDKIEF